MDGIEFLLLASCWYLAGFLSGLLSAAAATRYRKRTVARAEIARIDHALLNLSERGETQYEGQTYDRSAIPRFLTLRASFERDLGL